MPDNIQEQIDEINTRLDYLENIKLERIAEILVGIRNTWTTMIPEPLETDVEDTNSG